MPERPCVTCGPPARFGFECELISETAGCRQTGGSGASCWGYNQSNIVRCGEQVYALSWRDDLTLVLFRRLGPGRWEAGPPLPPAPQNGNLLVDGGGRAHVISGPEARYHAVFDPPGQVRRYVLQQRPPADSRFGAAIDDGDRILVAGGLAEMVWHVLEPDSSREPFPAGRVRHDGPRGYHFVAFRGSEGHTFCSDDYFVEGEQYPRQTVTYRDFATGQMQTVETRPGIYPVLRTYYYYCPDLFRTPDDWRPTVVSDVSDTFRDGARGTTEQQDLMIDDQGWVHLIYYENRQPSTAVWASAGQDARRSRLYHAVGRPGGPFAHFCLGAFNSGRLYQGPDGRVHYLLTRGRRGVAEALWYAAGAAGAWDRISEPVRLEMPSRFWHLFTSAARAGGTRAPCVDCYWTGAYQHNSNQVWYGRLTPA